MPLDENSTETTQTTEEKTSTGSTTPATSEKADPAPAKAETSTTKSDAASEEKPLLTAEPPAAFDIKSLKIPEGMTVPEDVLSSFGEVATKHALKGEAAQEVFDLGQKIVAKVHEENLAKWAETQKKWRDEITADKDFGGEKLKPTLAKVAKLMDRYSDPGWRDVLNATYMGNNPLLIRTLARMADAFTEPGHVAGKPAAAAQQSVAATFFPSMKE